MTLILLSCMSLILLYQLPAVNYFTISASLLVHSQQIVTDNKFLNLLPTINFMTIFTNCFRMLCTFDPQLLN